MKRSRVDHTARAPEGRAAPGDAIFGALLFVVALVPRLYVAVFWAGEPVWDGHYYDFGARRIAEGAGYSDDLTIAGHLVWHPWCHYPVGYSAFLAVFYRLFGDGRAVAAVANVLVGAALAVVTWALAGRALSPLRARAAGVLVALHPGLILYAALVMSEPLAALLTLLAFWAAVASRRAGVSSPAPSSSASRRSSARRRCSAPRSSRWSSREAARVSSRPPSPAPSRSCPCSRGPRATAG